MQIEVGQIISKRAGVVEIPDGATIDHIEMESGTYRIVWHKSVAPKLLGEGCFAKAHD